MDNPLPAYRGEDPFLFVCYSHDDKDVVYAEIAWLQGQGINVWYDEGISAGSNWRAAIGTALLDASHFLFFISNRSVSSLHCSREIHLALDEGKSVVPVYLEDVNLPPDLRVGLAPTHALRHAKSGSHRKALLAALQASESGANETSAVAVESTRRKMIAVLPFTTLDSKTSRDFLGDGISEELMGVLAKIPGVAVTSRASAFAFKGSSLGLHEIAGKLRVNYLLNGSVRREGEELRVRAELVDADSDVSMWSQTYKIPVQNLVAAQDEITESVASALRIELVGSSHRSIETDPEAHLLYLRGLHALADGSESGLNEALKLCKESLSIDPLYAPAYACLAGAYSNLANRHVIPQKVGYELAGGAARKAIKHDPNSSFAYQTLAFIDLYHVGDLASSLHCYRRAMELSPGSGGPKGGMSLLLASIGRFDEAIELSKTVAELDPLDSIAQSNLAAAYFWGGRWQDSLDRYMLVKTMSPDFFAVQYRVAECLLCLGQAEDALAAAESESNAPYRLIGLALANHALGRESKCDEAVQELVSHHGDIAAYNLGCIMAFRGQNDAAFDFLERELELSGRGVFSEILGEPWFKSLYEDPRWEPFLHKVGRSPDQLSSQAL